MMKFWKNCRQPSIRVDRTHIPEDLLSITAGPCGTWQSINIAALSLVLFLYGMNLYVSEFIAPHRITYYCKGSDQKNVCKYENGSACREYVFDFQYAVTAQSKWLLTCRDKILASVNDGICRMGLVVGYLICGFLADRLGRIVILYATVTFLPFVGVLIMTCPSYDLFVVSRFILSLCLSGNELMVMVLVCEFAGNRQRTLALSLTTLAYPLSLLLIPCFWLIFENNFRNFVFLTVPQLFIYALVCFIKNPASWLTTRNKMTEAEKTIRKAAVVNGNRLPSSFKIRPITTPHHQTSSNTVWRSLKTSMRWNIIALLIIWCAIGVLIKLVLLSFWIKTEMKLMEITCIAGAAGFFGVLISTILCELVRHKFIIALATIIGSVFFVIPLLLLNIFGELYYELAAFCLYSTCFAALWNATPRMFPTCLRSQLSGLCLCVFQIGAIIARLLILLTNVFVVACVVLTLMSIIVIFSFFFIYNVHKRELPDFLFDAVNFRRQIRPNRWTSIRRVTPIMEEVEMKVTNLEVDELTPSEYIHPVVLRALRKSID